MDFGEYTVLFEKVEEHEKEMKTQEMAAEFSVAISDEDPEIAEIRQIVEDQVSRPFVSFTST